MRPDSVRGPTFSAVKLSLDLDLEDLEEALKHWLPAGIKPRSLRLDGDKLRLEAKAPLLGAITAHALHNGLTLALVLAIQAM